jgi:hypothetical protein
LIRAAIRDLYRPAWSQKILDEMAASLKRELGVDPQRVDRTVRLMRENCPHLLVEGYEDLIAVMRNHPKDRHVLAAAVRVGANTIVKRNTKDFPAHTRQPLGTTQERGSATCLPQTLTDPMPLLASAITASAARQ